MKRKIGFLAGLDFVSQSPQKVIDTLLAEGYQAVSWPLCWFDPRVKTENELENLVHAVESSGIQVSEWVVQLDYVICDEALWSDRVRHTIEAIHALSQTGIEAPINLFTGPAPWDNNAPLLHRGISEGKAWCLVNKAFSLLLDAAQRENVTLAVEPVFGHLVHDYYSLMELLHHHESKYLKVNFDPSHGVLYQNDTGWVIRQLGDKIVHVHLKDAVGRPGGLPGETFQFPLLGEGEVPWQDMMKALDDIDYRGYLTVEFESFKYYAQVLKGDPALAARQAMNDLKRIGLDT